MDLDLVHRFRESLPRVRRWIEEVCAEHAPRAVAVADLGYPRLASYFPTDVLRRARVVAVPRVPFPPLPELGLPELAALTQMDISGVTYGDLFFVHEERRSESLHFHELVHVVQWETLGWNRFLLAYGVGLVRHGYRDSPFEAMAYELTDRFERGDETPGCVDEIRARTSRIWDAVAPLVTPP